MSRPEDSRAAPARSRLAAASLALALAASSACRLGDAPCDGRPCAEPGAVELKLVRGGAALADEDVELRFENPPGGVVALRTDAGGRVKVPEGRRGLRFQVGTDCPRPGQCRRYYAPAKLEGDSTTVELTGGLNYP